MHVPSGAPEDENRRAGNALNVIYESNAKKVYFQIDGNRKNFPFIYLYITVRSGCSGRKRQKNDPPDANSSTWNI
jgi:hypothetical protein